MPPLRLCRRGWAITDACDLKDKPVTAHAPNLDAAEVDQFNKIAAEWWDPNGAFKPLHALAPARLAFIRGVIDDHMGSSAAGDTFGSIKPLKGRTVLDVGCGGGLASEPLARLGGTVTGIDPGAENIGVATTHARQMGLPITYRQTTAETLAETDATFDLVVCLEVLEHVPTPGDLVATLTKLVAPGGVLVLSTLNRTAKSYALAIVGAEYLLRWLEPGTHAWDKFIKPEELEGMLDAAGYAEVARSGIVLDPMTGQWGASSDQDVNYMMAAKASGR